MLRIGLDLDNTLIRYDRAFVTAARERGLIPPAFDGTKQRVRDHIRALPGSDGEIEWQKLQGYVYGAGIGYAELFPGVTAFLERAKRQGASVHIVSHKTEFGHFDPAQVNLRDAAQGFMEAQGLFTFVPREQLFFCTTRLEKLQKIAEIRCDVFVDDLEEVLTDPAFPAGTRRLLFTEEAPDSVHGLETCGTWPEIEKSIFDAARNAR